MKKSVYLLLILVTMALYTSGTQAATPGPDQKTAASRQAAAPFFKTVTPEEARALIETDKNLLLVDVRNPAELREGAIADSTLMPLMDIVKGKTVLPKDRPILLICAVGGRSLALGKLMSQYGWPEIYNLKGGISAWKKAGLPLTY